MSEKFRSRFEILDRESSAADWSLHIGSRCVTEHSNLFDQAKIKSSLIIDAYTFAQWVAANWWRILYETEDGSRTLDNQRFDWQMSHRLSAAGEGICWPNLLFCSDGQNVLCKAQTTNNEGLPIRFLNNAEQWVGIDELDAILSENISQIIDVLDCGERDNLRLLWSDILKEKSLPEAIAWRAMEARLGFDPDDAPDDLIETFLNAQSCYGVNAVNEIACSFLGSSAKQKLEEVKESVNNSPFILNIDDFRRSVTSDHCATPIEKDAPWRVGSRLAQHARESLALDGGPIPDKALSDIVSVDASILQPGNRGAQSFISAGLTVDNGIRAVVAGGRTNTKRFSMARLLGDILLADGDSLYPVTKSKTARQKFQRAFAQEFLCPYESLIDYLQSDFPDEEQIEEAAGYFDVSDKVVEHTLENNWVHRAN